MGMPSLVQKKIVDQCWEISPFHLPARVTPGACKDSALEIVDTFKAVGSAVSDFVDKMKGTVMSAIRWFE